MARIDETQGTQGNTAPDAPMAEHDTSGGGMAVWSSTVDLGVEELGIPFLSLQQGLSKAVTAENSNVKMGDWLAQGFEPMKKVQFVPLQFGISRNYALPNPNDPDELVQHCYSPTGNEHGIAVTPDGPGMPCHECPLKDWTPTGETKNGRAVNNPPLCKRSLDFMGYSVELGTLVRVGFRSTGEKAGRQLAMLAKTRGLGNFMVELGSERSQGGRYTYAVPTVTIVSPDLDVLAEARGMLGLPAGD